MAESVGRAGTGLSERAGRAALRRAWPIYARGIAKHFARHLDDAEARILTDTLERVRAVASSA